MSTSTSATAWVPSHVNVRTVSESGAPEAATLIGLATGDRLLALSPAIDAAAGKVAAWVGGFVRDPLNALRARDALLARRDPSFDVHLADGGKLRVLDAYSGELVMHLQSARFDPDKPSLHVAFPNDAAIALATVRDDPHAPNAPVGFHNLERAQSVVQAMQRVLASASGSAPNRVNAVRLQQAQDKLSSLANHLGELAAVKARQPILARVSDAAAKAYAARKPGDAADLACTALLSELRQVADRDGSALGPTATAALRRDLETLEADRQKWLAFHNNGVSSFYLGR